jgi:hypothetical protein
MDSFELNSGTVLYLREIGPRQIVLRCESLAVRVSPGTPLVLGEIFSFPLTLPSAGTRLYTGVVDQIDPAHDTAFLSGLEDILGPITNPLDPTAGASVVPPRTLITPIQGQPVGSIDVSRLTIRINVTGLPPGTPPIGSVSVFGATLPTGSTLDGCQGCPIHNVTGNGIPYFNVTNPGQQLTLPFTIRVDNPGSPADDLGILRSEDSLTLVLKSLSGASVLDLDSEFTKLPLEPVVGPIRANFVQDPCPATMPLPLPHEFAAGCTTYYRATAKQLDGSQGEPYEILPGQPPLSYSWQLVTLAIPGAVKCGVFTSDATDPAWFSWYHPGMPTDPRSEPNPWCSHTSPYHRAWIEVTVSDAHYDCLVVYHWGSRGVPDPTSGLPPEYSDYSDPNTPTFDGLGGYTPVCIPPGK